MRRGTLHRLLLLLLALAMVAAACGGDDDDDGAGAPETTEQERAAKGGTLVVGAEQELDCADWISSCAGASWGVWTIQAHTMPRALEYNYETDKYDATDVLADDPELDEGPPMTVTYKLNPKAVWSDGSPMTSTDFKYTWDQIVTGEDIYDKTGYEKIESVDDSKKDTAVVTYSEPYAAWQDLFGGFYGIFPSHLLQGKDRNAEMKDGYKFSGGPWVLDSWSKGQEIKLVPNPRYWGKKPNLDALVFKFSADTSAEIQGYKTGQFAMIYPQAQLELTQLQNLPDTEFDVDTSLNFEAVWFNLDKPPLNSKPVRQALTYATDKNAIVKQLFEPVQSDIKPIQAFMTQANEKWYKSEPFGKYTRNLTKVDELMKADGWAKGADGIWAKGGRRAVIENSTTAGNKRRETTQELLRSQWREAGFELKVNNTTPATLFGEWGPKGVFQSAIYAQVPPSPDPGICSLFCSKNIPTTQNPSGTNWYRLKSDAVDKAWLAADTELDEDERLKHVRDGQAALAEEVPGIPIDPFPDVIVYNSAKIKGKVLHQLTYGPWFNSNEWFCPGGRC